MGGKKVMVDVYGSANWVNLTTKMNFYRFLDDTIEWDNNLNLMQIFPWRNLKI